MTDTCTCAPDDCHGGHTINVGPAWVNLPDERLRQLRDDPNVCTNVGERSMAAELLALRARVTELEADSIDRDFGIQAMSIAPGESTLSTTPTTERARNLVLAMSLACGRMLDEDQAPNYVEFEVSPANHAGYVVHVRRAEGRSPHTLRRDAEARAEKAEARIAELEAERDDWQKLSAKWNTRFAQLSNQGAELDQRGRELETAQRELIGFAVVRRPIGDGSAAVVWSTVDQARTAEGIASGYAIHPTVAEAISSVGRSDQPAGSDLVLVELREVTDHG